MIIVLLSLISILLIYGILNRMIHFIRGKLKINIDEVFVWIISILPAYIVAYILHIYVLSTYGETDEISHLVVYIIAVYCSFWIFVFKWFAMIFKNKEETNLQIKYSTIWGVGIILSQIAKHSQIAYHIWKIIFLPVIAISSSTDFMPSDGFVALSLVMCGLSLFLIWGYRKSS